MYVSMPWVGGGQASRQDETGLPGRFASPSPGTFCCLVEELQVGTTIDLVLALYTRWCGHFETMSTEYRYWYATAYILSTEQE